MRTECDPRPLFKGGGRLPMDQLAQRLFEEVDAAAARALDAYTGGFGEPPRRAEDLDRVLGQAVRAALPRLVDRPLLKSVLGQIEGDLPCSSRELRRNLAGAGVRPIEHDILYTLVYGLRHGLQAQDIAAIPIDGLQFTFGLDEGLGAATLAAVDVVYSPGGERGYLATTSQGDAILRTGRGLEKVGGKKDWTWILLLPWKEIFECLRNLVELIADALKSGKEDRLKEALEEIDEALEDIDDELEDLDEDIEDKKKEIDEETDRDDRKELEKELDELEDKKDSLDKAKEELEKAKGHVKDAMKTAR